MADAAKDLLQTIDLQLAASAGNADKEIELRSYKAHVLTMSGDLQAAAHELGLAASAAERVRAWAKQSECLFGQGLLLTRTVQQPDVPHQVFVRAASAAKLARDGSWLLKAHQRIVQLYSETGAWDQALIECDVWIRMLTQLSTTGRLEELGGAPMSGIDNASALLVEALRGRAVIHQARGQLDRALGDLDQSVIVAKDVGDPAQLLQAQWHHKSIHDVLHPDNVISIDAFIDTVRAIGDRTGTAQRALEQAQRSIRAGDHERADTHAERARDASLDSPDPARYLIATMIIAESRARRGDRAGVLETLLTSRRTLTDMLGPAGGHQIQIVLDSLEQRWGRDGIRQALSEYRQRAREPAIPDPQ